MNTSSSQTDAGNFRLEEAIALLDRTPRTLEALLSGLDRAWVDANEGEGTWTAHQVVIHLLQTERSSWIPRVQHILQGNTAPFPPVDRTAGFDEGSTLSMQELLDQFADQRRANLETLRGINPSPDQLGLTGQHPQFGTVQLGQLLATWTVHDLTHLAQIARVMAKRYTHDVGPWIANLSILQNRNA